MRRLLSSSAIAQADDVVGVEKQLNDGMLTTHQPKPQPTDQPASGLAVGEGQQLQPAGQMNGGGGLADPALLVQDCDQLGMTY